jgi:hypothetical protein
MAQTLKVNYVRELGPAADNDSFATYLVIGREKKRIRVMRIDQLALLREANRTPPEVTDVDFLMGDQQFSKFMKGVGVSHIEFALCRMSPKKENGRRVEFPANAFEAGTTKATKTQGK